MPFDVDKVNLDWDALNHLKDFIGEVVIVGNCLQWVWYCVGLHGCDKLD